jgi:hypothetical protein
MSFTSPDALPSAPNPAMASADVSMFTNMDPETRDDSEDPWRFEVSREEVFRLGLPVPLLRVREHLGVTL